MLLDALYNPVWKEGVTGARDVAMVFAAFALLEVSRSRRGSSSSSPPRLDSGSFSDPLMHEQPTL